jgi:hypothetical protein
MIHNLKPGHCYVITDAPTPGVGDDAFDDGETAIDLGAMPHHEALTAFDNHQRQHNTDGEANAECVWVDADGTVYAATIVWRSTNLDVARIIDTD